MKRRLYPFRVAQTTKGDLRKRVKVRTKVRSLAAIRRAVADYIVTEGCDCCRNIEGHEKASAALGRLLRARMYADGSGYDWYRYATEAGGVGGGAEAPR